MLRRTTVPPTAATVAAATTAAVARRAQSSMWSTEPPRQELPPTNKNLDAASKFDAARRAKARGGAPSAVARLAEVDARRGKGDAFKWERGDAADEAGDDSAAAVRHKLEQVKRSLHEAESHRYAAKHAKQGKQDKWWVDRKAQPTPLETTGFPLPRVSYSASGSSFSAQRTAEGQWVGQGESWEVPTQDIAALNRAEKPITAVRQQWSLNPATMTFEEKKLLAGKKKHKKHAKKHAAAEKKHKFGAALREKASEWRHKAADAAAAKRSLAAPVPAEVSGHKTASGMTGSGVASHQQKYTSDLAKAPKNLNASFQAERGAVEQAKDALRRAYDERTGKHTASKIRGSGTGAYLAMQAERDAALRAATNARATRSDNTGIARWGEAFQNSHPAAFTPESGDIAALGIRLAEGNAARKQQQQQRRTGLKPVANVVSAKAEKAAAARWAETDTKRDAFVHKAGVDSWQRGVYGVSKASQNKIAAAPRKELKALAAPKDKKVALLAAPKANIADKKLAAPKKHLKHFKAKAADKKLAAPKKHLKPLKAKVADKKKLKLHAAPKAVVHHRRRHHKVAAALKHVAKKAKQAPHHVKKHHKKAASKTWNQTQLAKLLDVKPHRRPAAHDPNSSHLQKVEWRFDTKTGSWEEWHQDMQTGRWTLAVDDSKIHASRKH